MKDDFISRQAILTHIEKIRQDVQMMDDTRRASIIMNGMYLCEKAVRNQPPAQLAQDLTKGCTDTISRWEAINLIEQMKPYQQDADDIAEMIQNMPSAQSGWIPCSKKMPEEHEWIGTKKFGTTISNEVYVTFETPDGERFAKHISFQNEKLSPVDEQRMKVWYKGAKPIAWMPLPKPWEGGQDE